MLSFDQVVEARIREAISRGELNGLAGEGAPLRLDDDSHVAPELRVAYRILKNAGYVPPEVDLRCKIGEVRQLLAAATDADDRGRAARRLTALTARLEASRGQAVSLTAEHAAYRAALTSRFAQQPDET